MIYSGSILFVDPELFDDAVKIVSGFPEVEIHAESEDRKQIVVSIETDNDQALDDITRRLKSYDPVIDVGHHIMHFEEDVKDILDGKTIPDLKAFQRSRRRDKNPLETKV